MSDTLQQVYSYKDLRLHMKKIIKIAKYLKGLHRVQVQQLLKGIWLYKRAIDGKYPRVSAKLLYRIFNSLTTSIKAKQKTQNYVIKHIIVNKGKRAGISARYNAQGRSSPIYLDTTSLKVVVRLIENEITA